MAKHLSEKDVKFIVDMINEWQGKLSWNLLLDTYEMRTEHRTTRQTLCSHEFINTAFQVKKKGTGKAKSKPNSIGSAADRIDLLFSENQQLKKQLSKYEEKFVRWLKNASSKNISLQDLDKKLKKVDRNRTDV